LFCSLDKHSKDSCDALLSNSQNDYSHCFSRYKSIYLNVWRNGGGSAGMRPPRDSRMGQQRTVAEGRLQPPTLSFNTVRLCSLMPSKSPGSGAGSPSFYDFSPTDSAEEPKINCGGVTPRGPP
jgi:hypothetical protein